MARGEVAVIDTWIDRARWYLGPNYSGLYVFRWTNDTDPHKYTPFIKQRDGTKFMVANKGSRVPLVSDVDDLKRVTDRYERGFIFIDDATLPQDVINYAQSHFKKEIYLDHYPLDDNPYSIWPATLYSWGTE